MEIDETVKAGDNYFLEKKKRRATQELYTANADEDVWTISQRFGVRQKSLMKYNHIKTSSSSIAGITLFLNDSKPESMTAAGDSAVAVLDDKDTFEWGAPTLQKTEDSHAQKAPDEEQQSPSGVGAAQQEVAAQAGNTASMTAGTHEVRPSDTIYSVSRQYGVTIRDLMEWNNKKDFGLIVGEKLKVRSH